MNVDHHIVKAIRDLHSRAVEDGEKRKKNEVSGPASST